MIQGRVLCSVCKGTRYSRPDVVCRVCLGQRYVDKIPKKRPAPRAKITPELVPLRAHQKRAIERFDGI